MFCLGLAICFFFNSRTHLANCAITVFLMLEISFVVTMSFLAFAKHLAFARPMYLFKSSLTVLVAVSLYASCGLSHFPFRGQLSLFDNYNQRTLFLYLKRSYYEKK